MLDIIYICNLCIFIIFYIYKLYKNLDYLYVCCDIKFDMKYIYLKIYDLLNYKKLCIKLFRGNFDENMCSF